MHGHYLLFKLLSKTVLDTIGGWDLYHDLHQKRKRQTKGTAEATGLPTVIFSMTRIAV